MGQAKRSKARRWIDRLVWATFCPACDGDGWAPPCRVRASGWTPPGADCETCLGNGQSSRPEVEWPAHLRWRAGECAHEIERDRGPEWLYGIPPLISDTTVDGRVRSARRGQHFDLDRLDLKANMRDPERLWPAWARGELRHARQRAGQVQR